MKKSHQKAIFESMMHASFYPHPVASIQRYETHISTVFLTGPFAYKIKKPVDLGFLDFSSLEKRKHYCRQEVALNRRLSHGIYLQTLPITVQSGGYTLAGPGVPVEFTVKMHQLAESDSMQHRLQRNRLDARDIEELTHLLIGFYAQAATDSAMDPVGGPAWQENLQLAEPFADVWIDRRQFAFVWSAADAFYRRHKNLFRRRRQEGKIRDCHGDLRTDHIYFTQKGIQIIDCIEFNNRLRYLDVISDLAFLAMDLEYSQRPELAWALIRSYVEQTNDIGALPLLDFYRCYRAMVRCKVSCLGYRDRCDDDLLAAAQDYLSLAHGYAIAFCRPILWVVCGLPASGKSTLAGALAARFDIDVIRSDVIRKSLLANSTDPSTESAFGKGLYSAHATEVTYRQVLIQAREALKKGKSVVIDATFSRTAQRAAVLRIAACHQSTPVFVECSATEATLAARLLKRETEPSLSDARLIHLQAFKKRFDPMDPMENEIHIRVDTENCLPDCLRQILLTEALWDGVTRKGGRHV